MNTAALSAMNSFSHLETAYYSVGPEINKQHQLPNPIMFSGVDTVVTTVMVASTSAATLMVTTPATTDELRLLLVPLIGAVISSGGMIMLNPKPETRQIVVGRSLIALFLATITPQIFALWFTSTATFLSHPVVLLGAGGMGAMVYYACSLPFCAGLYSRSATFSKLAIDKAEGVLLGKVGDVVENVVNGKIQRAQVAATIVAHQQAKEVLASASTAAVELIKTAADVASHKSEQPQ